MPISQKEKQRHHHPASQRCLIVTAETFLSPGSEVLHPPLLLILRNLSFSRQECTHQYVWNRKFSIVLSLTIFYREGKSERLKICPRLHSQGEQMAEQDTVWGSDARPLLHCCPGCRVGLWKHLIQADWHPWKLLQARTYVSESCHTHRPMAATSQSH